MDQMFPYFYVKYCKISLDVESSDSFVMKGILTKDQFEIISKTFYVLGCILLFPWLKYLDEHSALMALSPKHYVSIVLKACFIENHLNCNIHESFISVCSLVTVIGKYIYTKTNRIFYRLTPLILTVFFENVMKKKFKRRGSWKRLEKYLARERFSDWYDSFESSMHLMDHFDVLPEEIRTKVKELTLRRKIVLASDMTIKGIEKEYQISHLTLKVISLVETSLLYELCWLSLDEEQCTSKPDDVSGLNSSRCSSTVCLKESKTTSELNQIPNNLAKDTSYIRILNDSSFIKDHFNARTSPIGHSSVAKMTISLDNILKRSNFRLEHFESTIKSLISIFDSLDAK